MDSTIRSDKAVAQRLAVARPCDLAAARTWTMTHGGNGFVPTTGIHRRFPEVPT